MGTNVGDTLQNRYRVMSLLGKGGMGAVFRTWDTRLNIHVALKEMTPQPGLDHNTLAQLRQQFQQEATVLARLDHPNLVDVTDFFEENDNAYLVMRFIEGESMANRIKRLGPLPERDVLIWTSQLLDALAYCHGRDVIHRDIKPQNIVISPEGRAMLVDFGLAKLWNPQDPRTRTVMRGAGTPEYAPPEQYDMGAGHTDARSDIYSVGATVYQALTAKAPPSATQRMASPVSFVPPRRINASISPAIEKITLKAMEIAMERRYQSAQEMRQAVMAVLQPSSTARRAVAQPRRRVAHPTETAPPAKQKSGVLLGLGGMGLAVVGVACLLLAVGAVVVASLLYDGNEAMGETSTPQPTLTSSATVTPEIGATETPDSGGETPDAENGTPVSTTATPRPIVTPSQDSGGILFQDDFSDPASGWEVGDYDGGNVGYKDGAYYVASTQENSTMWGVAHTSFDDVVIEVDATQVLAGPDNNNDYGVICREQGDGKGYYLLISGDGFYAIAKTGADGFDWLAEWTKGDAIRQGNATNHIRAICSGSTLSLFVNGERVATAQDNTYPKGDIALTATTYEEDPTQIRFDNLVVREPSTATDLASVQPTGYIPSLDAQVTDLLFFESGYDAPPADERVYASSFGKATSRYINWELHLDHPAPGRRIDFQFHVIYLRADGSVFAEPDSDTYMEADWEGSVYYRGWGWSEAGEWPAGTYDVEVWVEGDLVTTGSFTIET